MRYRLDFFSLLSPKPNSVHSVWRVHFFYSHSHLPSLSLNLAAFFHLFYVFFSSFRHFHCILINRLHELKIICLPFAVSSHSLGKNTIWPSTASIWKMCSRHPLWLLLSAHAHTLISFCLLPLNVCLLPVFEHVLTPNSPAGKNLWRHIHLLLRSENYTFEHSIQCVFFSLYNIRC